jgi:farnesyl diphosphate synthase
MAPDVAFEAWTRACQHRIEDVLERSLPAADDGALVNAMRYAVLGGGKRVRPLLAYAAGEALAADPSRVDPCAAAVELIHAYSLVHDDLPCMDNDVLRRGKPTCHVAFGEATALLAGDALQAQAFFVLGNSNVHDAGRACALLAHAAGEAGMAGGQGIDLANVGRSMSLAALESMHRKKTGALILAAVMLGGSCAQSLAAPQSAALDVYARAAGLAFQVVDDILDVEGTAAILGKTAGKDAAHNKPTYVTLLGVDEAKRRADALCTEAHDALAPLGRNARRLHELADWIARRSH